MGGGPIFPLAFGRFYENPPKTLLEPKLHPKITKIRPKVDVQKTRSLAPNHMFYRQDLASRRRFRAAPGRPKITKNVFKTYPPSIENWGFS